MHDAAREIARLELVRHPEGGWYRETFRSSVVWPTEALPAGYPGPRAAVTSILYLLEQGQSSRSHRVRSEEIWMHHSGDDLELTLHAAGASPSTILLGCGENAVPQVVVPGGWWQQARPLPGSHGYALMGCVVAPGFDFEDFEMAEPPAAG